MVQANLGIIRTEFGRFARQVSGYSLEHLLPENRFDVTRFLAGSEGTLAVIIGATVRLVADAPHKIMIVLGYPTMADAADAAPLIVDHRPTACEGLDRRIVDVVRRTRGDAAVPPLPRGDGWMFVELVDEDLAELRIRADALLAAAGALDGLSWPIPRKRWRCGRSGRTVPAWRALALPDRPIPVGRTPQCRSSTSAHTCVTSTSCLLIMDWRGCRTVTSATDACTYASTFH